MEGKNQNSEIKKGVSNDYLKHIIDTKNIPLSRQKLLIELIERKVDHRTLLKFKTYLCDLFPDQDIPLEEWRKQSPKYFKTVPEDIQEKLELELLTEDGLKIDKEKLLGLLDTYQFLPIKIKRDKNKSENLYYIMSSNKRDKPNSKEEILQQLKQENDQRHLSKIMTLIAIKIEEKFQSLAKAFLFFDQDNDQNIQIHEFYKGIDGLRVKVPKRDIDEVFKHMDQDCDGSLNYKEFCGFSEEKRRNIDPFDSQDN